MGIIVHMNISSGRPQYQAREAGDFEMLGSLGTVLLSAEGLTLSGSSERDTPTQAAQHRSKRDSPLYKRTVAVVGAAMGGGICGD